MPWTDVKVGIDVPQSEDTQIKDTLENSYDNNEADNTPSIHEFVNQELQNASSVRKITFTNLDDLNINCYGQDDVDLNENQKYEMRSKTSNNVLLDMNAKHS